MILSTANSIRRWSNLLFLLPAVVAITLVACDSDRVVTRGDLKNRVVTMPDSTEAKQAAADAKESAAQAQDALKKIQDAQREPVQPTVIYTTDGTPQERTGVGRITDVTEIWEEASNSYNGEAYEAFTFLEDSGFSKRFYPVCSDQTIQTGKSEVILYHWKPNMNNSKHNQKGCFRIDGYLQKGQL
jgi:hypothetical protein